MKARKKQNVTERRDDTPRAGFRRWTVIVEEQLVNYLKDYAKDNKVFVADVVTDALNDWKKRHTKG